MKAAPTTTTLFFLVLFFGASACATVSAQLVDGTVQRPWSAVSKHCRVWALLPIFSSSRPSTEDAVDTFFAEYDDARIASIDVFDEMYLVAGRNCVQVSGTGTPRSVEDADALKYQAMKRRTYQLRHKQRVQESALGAQVSEKLMKQCYGGDGASCFAIARLIGKDDKDYRDYLRRSCELGMQLACKMLEQDKP